jgi:DNA-binding CsgD family transcriptional regulator
LLATGLAVDRDDELRGELLSGSAAILEPSPCRLEHAHSLVELGAFLRRANQRVAARARLEDGLELAARCGAEQLVSRAQQELAATGARARREWRTGVAALTASELRVARMAADGASNREIAQALYVSKKTVEKHLANAYMKLDVDGRARLADALAEPAVSGG